MPAGWGHQCSGISLWGQAEMPAQSLKTTVSRAHRREKEMVARPGTEAGKSPQGLRPPGNIRKWRIDKKYGGKNHHSKTRADFGTHDASCPGGHDRAALVYFLLACGGCRPE